MEKQQKMFLLVALFVLGIIAGGYLFRDMRPRSFLAVDRCADSGCLKPNELAGLVASVGLKLGAAPLLQPVVETDKTVAIEYEPGWTVVFPKRDIQDASDLSTDDTSSLADAYAVMGRIIRERKMTDWQIVTNGPGLQHVRYLHFHLYDRSKR